MTKTFSFFLGQSGSLSSVSKEKVLEISVILIAAKNSCVRFESRNVKKGSESSLKVK